MSRAAKLGWLFFLGLIVFNVGSPQRLPTDLISVWLMRHGLFWPFVLTWCGVIVASLVVVVVVGRANARDLRRLAALRRLTAELIRQNAGRAPGDRAPRK